MISVKTFFSREYRAHTILLIGIFAIFLFSLLSFLIGQKSHRRIFIFPSADDGQYIIEYRNLAKNPHQGDINYFVDELLLGSTIERTKFIFTPETKVLSCFSRNNVLYLNLSSDLLAMGDGVVEIKDGINLLKENVKKNFSKIDEVEVFVNGKIAFDN